MKITTAWVASEVDGQMPWLVAAFDEWTGDDWNGTPEFFASEVRKHRPEDVRIVEIDISADLIANLFTPKRTEGAASVVQP